MGMSLSLVLVLSFLWVSCRMFGGNKPWNMNHVLVFFLLTEIPSTLTITTAVVPLVLPFCCLKCKLLRRVFEFLNFGSPPSQHLPSFSLAQMGVGTSTFVIRWINFLTMLLAVGVIGFGVWMSTHHDSCRKSLTLPVLGLGAFIFLISIIGFMGALKNNSILLWIYLIMLCFILVAILVFTVLAFIITNNGSGHNVAGLRYKEYQLQDYSSWFLKQLNNTHNWKHLKSCLVKSEDCNNLSKKYKTLKQYKIAKLTPIEAGCCRPPSECGYPAVNASYYDLSFHPISSNKDCKLYKNSRAIKCYNCDSCKAGVAQYMKTEWRVVAIFNVVLFVVLSMVYLVGCCARRNATSSRSKA